MLSKMKWPWSPNLYTNHPSGEPFWYLIKFTQFWQWMYMWVITRFASPYFAVNSLFLLGWITTGVIVFYIARKLQLPVAVAMGCGLIVQTLPWFREKLTAHTSFMFISIPLLVVFVSLNLLESRTKKSIFFVASLLLGSAFFDMYLFYISSAAVGFLVLISSSNRIIVSKFIRRHALAASASIVALFIFYFLLTVFLLPLTNRAGMRQITIVNRSFLDTLSGSILDFVMPDRHHWFFPQKWDEHGGLRWGLREVPLIPEFAQDVPNYMGIPVVAMFIVSFLPNINRLLSRDVRILRALAVFLFALSMRTLTFGSYAIPAPSAVFKFIFPGSRVFSRFALLAEPLAIIVSIYVVYIISRFLKIRIIRSLVAFSFVFIVLLDFHPTNNREYLRDHEQFSMFNSEIRKTNEGVLVVSDIADGAITGPTINGISEIWKSTMIRNSEENALAAYLASLGVGYVVTDKDASLSPSNSTLSKPNQLIFSRDRFPLLKTLKYRNVTYQLLSVRPKPLDKFCVDCLPYSLFVDYGFVHHSTTAGGASWVTERRLDLVVSPLFRAEDQFQLRMVIAPPFGGFAEPRNLLIEVNGKTESFRINPPFTTIELNVDVDSVIKFVDNDKCVRPSELEENNPDSRCLLYGILNIDVIEPSK
jgi:hypothetical protein